MTTNAAESYMRGWSFGASEQQGGDQADTDAHHEKGRVAGAAALACVAGRSTDYRQGWKDAALGPIQANRVGAYTLGVADGQAAKQLAHAVAQKL